MWRKNQGYGRHGCCDQCKGTTTTATGIQEILNAYKKGYDNRPLAVRFIGTITDPAVTEGGICCWVEIATASGFPAALLWKVLARMQPFVDLAFGQRISPVWKSETLLSCWLTVAKGITTVCSSLAIMCGVHNCDSFYGLAGSDADQAKGDGALDCKNRLMLHSLTITSGITENVICLVWAKKQQMDCILPIITTGTIIRFQTSSCTVLFRPCL